MKPKKFVWKNRDNDLSKVIRYFDPNHRFEVMYYRTNLLVHYRRVEAITKSIIPLAQECYPGLDTKIIPLMNIYHDDHELIGGDTSHQLKLIMEENSEEKEIEAVKEISSIDKICKYYPKKIKGYWYKDILLRTFHKQCRESQLHSLADKHDGYHEAIHELLGGNSVFVEPVLNYQQGVFAKRYARFSLIDELFDASVAKKNPFLHFPVIDLMDFFSNGRRVTAPHTPESLQLVTGIPSYEAWKNITLRTFKNGVDLLTKQIEFQ
jgi:5'-deoxynucleotidase YfbR-like HD superfamily hydrolase